jgi:hypothetical protein
MTNISDNSFSGNFGWLPSVANIFSFSIWMSQCKKAYDRNSLSRSGLYITLAVDTAYSILHLLRFTANRIIPFITGGIILAFELYSETRLAITLYCITKELQKNPENTEIILSTKPPKKSNFSLLAKTDQCFHKSFFSKLEENLVRVECNEMTKVELKDFIHQNINKTAHMLIVGLTTVALTAAIIFIPMSLLTPVGYFTLLALSCVTYGMRYYGADKYLKIPETHSIEMKEMPKPAVL